MNLEHTEDEEKPNNQPGEKKQTLIPYRHHFIAPLVVPPSLQKRANDGPNNRTNRLNEANDIIKQRPKVNVHIRVSTPGHISNNRASGPLPPK